MRRLLLVLLLLSGMVAVVEGIVPCEVAEVSPRCFVALRPGPTRDALTIVELPGEEVSTSAGELVLTTVSVQSDLGVGDLLDLRGDPTSDRVDRDLYFPPDVNPDDVRDRFVAQMTESEQAAAVAALRYLGADLEPTGARIEQVLEGTASDGVVEAGEVITALAGQPVAEVDDVLTALEDLAPGDTTTVAVEDADGATEQDVLELGANPDDPSRPFLGLLLASRVDVPVEVDIDAGQIAGPSAGLMFALTIVDLLSEEDLTGGLVIAGTGEIDLAGRVGPIGGIQQKIPGAIERDGDAAEVFLVPRDNVEEARGATVGQPITLVPVDTLADAVDALAVLRQGGTPDGALELGPDS